jgi:hypothetical protein
MFMSKRFVMRSLPRETLLRLMLAPPANRYGIYESREIMKEGSPPPGSEYPDHRLFSFPMCRDRMIVKGTLTFFVFV